jgi:hypothetical protein
MPGCRALILTLLLLLQERAMLLLLLLQHQDLVSSDRHGVICGVPRCQLRRHAVDGSLRWLAVEDV